MNTKTKKKRRKKKKASGFKIKLNRLKHKYKTLSKKKKKAVNAVIIILCVALIAGLCAVAVAIHNGKVENFKFNTDKDRRTTATLIGKPWLTMLILPLSEWDTADIQTALSAPTARQSII